MDKILELLNMLKMGISILWAMFAYEVDHERDRIDGEA